MYQPLPPINIEWRAPTPAYSQIVAQLINHILNGKLRRGQKLPGSRVLAAEIKVHRKTLQNAIDELASQGWVTISPRKGVFVNRELPELKIIKAPDFVPSSYPRKTNFSLTVSKDSPPSADFQQSQKLLLVEGLPDMRIAPIHQVMRELRSIEKRGNMKRYFQYGNPLGIPYLRETLSQYLVETRHLNIQPDQVMITRGTQMGIYLAASVLVKPGDRVVVGDPNYITATKTFERLGADIVRIPVDDHGIDVDKLEHFCKKNKIRLVYVITHHHFPTTVTLSLERRIRLLNLATKYKFVILEDDFDYDFHYSSNPVAPLATLDNRGNVIYLGTLTKTLMPALRVGFMIAPDPFIQEAGNLRRLIDFQGDSVMEAAVAELYRNGAISSHIKKAVRIYHERRDTFCKLLTEKLGDQISFRKPDGGLNVWVKFHKANLTKLSQQVAKEGIIINDGTIYNTKHSKNFVRLGFSSLNYEEQKRAVQIIHDCLAK